MLGPAHRIGKLLGATQGLGIKEIFAVERDAAEDAVVELVLDIVDILAVGSGLEQTPRIEQHAYLCTNLVVGCLLWQLELTSVSLVNLLDAGLIIRRTIGRDTIVQSTAAAHNINLVLNDVVPNG